MTASVNSAVIDARPPELVVRLTNLIMRPLLRTPIGRLVKPLALLEFTGRRSGARRRVVVGWHRDSTTRFVLTPARWRENFADGHPATLHWCGQRSTVTGTLDTDPAHVAAAVNTLLQAGTSPRSLALQIPAGHSLDGTDITRTNRAIIRFEQAEPTTRATTNSTEHAPTTAALTSHLDHIEDSVTVSRRHGVGTVGSTSLGGRDRPGSRQSVCSPPSTRHLALVLQSRVARRAAMTAFCD